MTLDRRALAALLADEQARFREANPRSVALAEAGRRSLLHGVPMPWMSRWAGSVPLYLDGARGTRVTDVDGHEYVDLALGDTGSMPGHSPEPMVAAVIDRLQTRGGATTMMPTEDAAIVGAELQRRWGLPAWQFTLSATDANRFVLRMCRQVQRRPKVLIFQWSYHGTVDETIAIADAATGEVVPKPGNVGMPVDLHHTTKVVEFGDLAAIEAALAPGDVACVLAEPALTNVGMVLPPERVSRSSRDDRDGPRMTTPFWPAVEALCRETATLLVYDETHTMNASPGGCVSAWGLSPDAVTMGKALGAGVPIGAYGLSAELRDRVLADEEGDYFDWGGVGGTLAGSALSLAAARATLTEVLTDTAYERMAVACDRYVAGARAIFAAHGLDWYIVQLGSRAEFGFVPEPPADGSAAHVAIDELLDAVVHAALLNRGVMLTPFHNMALFGPATGEDDVERVLAALDEVCGLVAATR